MKTQCEEMIYEGRILERYIDAGHAIDEKDIRRTDGRRHLDSGGFLALVVGS